MKYVLEVLPLVVRAANDVPLASLERDEERRRRLFMLRQTARPVKKTTSQDVWPRINSN